MANPARKHHHTNKAHSSSLPEVNKVKEDNKQFLSPSTQTIDKLPAK
jgi:hypothetical protein